MIQAERGIPVPTIRSPGRLPKYPWRTMKTGESFPVKTSLGTARSAAFHASKRVNHGAQFVAALYRGKPRVWRVK